MRKITSQSVEAFKNGRKYKSGNTIVSIIGNSTVFYLHNNCIAVNKRETDTLLLSDCGWNTNTTKERLNGILKAFNLPYYICQSDFEWYIGHIVTGQKFLWLGECKINLVDRTLTIGKV